jgi:hypothetical protein
MALAISIHFFSFKFIKKSSIKSLSFMDTADTLQDLVLNKSSENEKIKILITQFKISKVLKDYYRNLAVSYYQNYYVFTICSIVYTIILAMFGFLLAGKGWQNSNPNIKTIFLLTTVFASFYYFLPNVLNNRLNLQKNIDSVKIFQKNQFDILSFLNSINKANESETDIFISNIYTTIKDNYDYNISIDTSLLNKNPLDNFKGLTGK